MGTALRDLPRIRDTHASGRLSWDQVRVLTKFVEPHEDAEWAERGPHMRPHRLRLEAQRRQKERERQEQIPDHSRRTFEMWWDEDRRFLPHVRRSTASRESWMPERVLGQTEDPVGEGEGRDPGGDGI